MYHQQPGSSPSVLNDSNSPDQQQRNIDLSHRMALSSMTAEDYIAIFRDPPEVVTDRHALLLRPLTPADAQDLFDMCSRLDVSQYALLSALFLAAVSCLRCQRHRYVRYTTHTDVSQARDFIADHMRRRQEGRPSAWCNLLRTSLLNYLYPFGLTYIGRAICLHGRLIGTFQYFELDLLDSNAEIGYQINSDHWRKGFGLDVLTRMIRFAREELQLHRVWALCHIENVASLALLGKLMAQEGVLKEASRKHGRWRDLVLFGLVL